MKSPWFLSYPLGITAQAGHLPRRSPVWCRRAVTADGAKKGPGGDPCGAAEPSHAVRSNEIWINVGHHNMIYVCIYMIIYVIYIYIYICMYTFTHLLN